MKKIIIFLSVSLFAGQLFAQAEKQAPPPPPEPPTTVLVPPPPPPPPPPPAQPSVEVEKSAIPTAPVKEEVTEREIRFTPPTIIKEEIAPVPPVPATSAAKAKNKKRTS